MSSLATLNGTHLRLALEGDPEANVCGSLMRFPQDIPAAIKIVSAGDFSNPDYGEMFQAIVDAHATGDAVDAVRVAAVLRTRKSPVSNVMVAKTLDCATSHIHANLNAIIENKHRRKLRLAMERAESELKDQSVPLDEVAGAMQEALADVAKTFKPGESSHIEAPDLLGKYFTDPKFAVDRIIVEGLTILAGPPKLGKSWLMLQIALAVVGGSRGLGMFDTTPGEVLYYALEDTQRRLKSRLMKLRRSWPDMETKGLHFNTEAKQIGLGFEAELRAFLREHPNTRLIIVDTLQRVQPQRSRNANAYSEDYKDIRALKAIADEFSVAIVAVHHTRKAADEDVFATMSGTQGLGGAADAMVILQRARGQSDAVLHITGRDVEEAEIAMEWNADSATWLAIGDAAKHRLNQAQSEIIAVFESSGGILGNKDVYEALEQKTGKKPNQSTTKYHLIRLAEEGHLISPARGTYHLPSYKPPTRPTNQLNQPDQPSHLEGEDGG